MKKSVVLVGIIVIVVLAGIYVSMVANILSIRTSSVFLDTDDVSEISASPFIDDDLSINIAKVGDTYVIRTMLESADHMLFYTNGAEKNSLTNENDYTFDEVSVMKLDEVRVYLYDKEGFIRTPISAYRFVDPLENVATFDTIESARTFLND
jgi:hypothetical protein